jgi:opacity protein-like surface antigen
MVLRRLLMMVMAACCLVMIASAAAADWSLYVSGELGTSSGNTQVVGDPVVSGTPLPFAGSYSDSAPIMGVAFGVVMPMDELTPWQLPYDMRLPRWPISFEIEITGLRNFEGTTDGPGAFALFGGTQSWAFMVDFWQGIPMETLNRPLGKLFGRVPIGVRRTLEKTTFEAGAGVGVSSLEVNFSDNFLTANDSSYNFAWQAGARFMYTLTDRVDLGVGYRYFDAGSIEGSLISSADVDVGPYSVDQSSHEFRFNVRVAVWTFASPWR